MKHSPERRDLRAAGEAIDKLVWPLQARDA